jgi:phage-related tail fiber protein
MTNPYKINPYVWTDHSMEAGVAPCDPDITDECLMHLKYNEQYLMYEMERAGIPGEIRMFAMQNPPEGWLRANGAAVARSTYPELDANIYCGSTNNATASWGYRCTSTSNPSGTRSTTGAYIVLPDLRGEFVRGWSNGRGVDAGRTLWSYQNGTVGNHDHYIKCVTIVGTNDDSVVTGNGSASSQSLNPILNSGTNLDPTNETRPRNVALLACIKY